MCVRAHTHNTHPWAGEGAGEGRDTSGAGQIKPPRHRSGGQRHRETCGGKRAKNDHETEKPASGSGPLRKPLQIPIKPPGLAPGPEGEGGGKIWSLTRSRSGLWALNMNLQLQVSVSH